MGWAGGSYLAEKIWLLVRHFIPEGDQRTLVARQVIDEFENEDCDTIDEAETLCQDAKRRTNWNSDDWDEDNLYEPLDDENPTQQSESND